MDAGFASVAAVLDRLGLPPGLLSPLLAHAASVASDSSRLGLVSAGDERHVLRRHTADSLLTALVRAPEPHERWVDVGSGAGFPGLPLAICYPSTRFTLVEATGKKAGFLERQVLDLGLANVAVAADRAERLEGGFDVGVCRALAKPDAAMGMLFSLVRDGGPCIVLATAAVRGARVVRVDVPEVDSPGTISMMTRSEPAATGASDGD